jgi:hypothetical protein
VYRLKMFFYVSFMRPSISLKDVILRAHLIGFLLSLLVWPLAFGFVAVLLIESRPRAFFLEYNFNKFNTPGVTATLRQTLKDL